MRASVLISVAVLALAGCATDPAPERPPITEAEKEAMRACWERFVNRDPRWPEARRQWLTMSEAAQNTLVENLIRYMSDEFNRNRVDEATRASAELILLDRRSLEYLVFLVADDRNSRGLRDLAVGCLVRIGTPAVPGLIESLESPRFQARRLAARGLGRIGDSRAIEPLSRLLQEDRNFVVRCEAAGALGRFTDERAMRALCRSVAEEQDAVVAEESARALGARKWAAAVPVLVERLRISESGGTSIALAGALREALSRITGLDRNSPPAVFGRWQPEARP